MDLFLPEDIIQYIQSFLTAKEAARTSIVSKSWHTAWLTRPDLVFDQRDFGGQRDGAEDIFLQFVRKTMRRYHQLNLRIQCLRLWMLFGRDNIFLAKQLIVRALKLGAIDINFEIEQGAMFALAMVLPKEVLGSETLRRLSVRQCMIGLAEDRRAKWSRLESLSLEKVVCSDGDIIRDIISSCPLIENLSMSDCKIEDFDGRKDCPIGPINPFYNLKSLFLEKMHIKNSFFDDFGSKFPCLKDLSVHNSYGYHGIRIVSSSLESISIVQHTMLRAKFDVPCIRKFMFEGTTLASLSFKNYSRGWKSDISITVDRLCASWFPRLRKLLAKLSQCEISLSLRILSFRDKSSDDGRDNGLPPVAVKDLIIYLQVPTSISSAFLNGLFRSCRPKFITLHFFPRRERSNYDFLKLLRETMMSHELSAVNFEVFYEGPAEWRRPLKTFLKDFMSPDYTGKIRLQLR